MRPPLSIDDPGDQPMPEPGDQPMPDPGGPHKTNHRLRTYALRLGSWSLGASSELYWQLRASTAQSSVPLRVLAVGLLVRFLLAPYTAWSNDVATWFHAALSGYYGLGLYERPGFSYPPFWGYCLSVIGTIVHVIGSAASFFGVDNPSLVATSAITGDFST